MKIIDGQTLSSEHKKLVAQKSSQYRGYTEPDTNVVSFQIRLFMHA